MSCILIVEDAAIIREPIEAALRHAGYETVTAVNGADAMAKLNEIKPDLIISDIVMPVMNGLTFLKNVRARPSTKSIPVMILSEVTQKECIVHCIRLGIAGYVLKTRFSLEQLLELIDKQLHPDEAANEPDRAAGAALESGSPTPSGKTATASSTASSPPDDGDSEYQKIEYVEDSDPLVVLKSLKPIVTRSQVTELADECGELKAMSPTVAEVLKLTGSDRCSIEQLSKAISRDHAIALKILKLANSSVYTRGEPVDSVHTAVVRIGMGQIRQAVLNISVVDNFAGVGKDAGFDTGQFWEHAIAVGMIAAEIAHARNEKDVDSAFTMGLLHDVGRMVYLSQLGKTYAHVLATAHKLQLPVEQVEQRVLLFNHADFMDRVLHAWKFPKQLINPIVFHHLSASNIRTSAPREINEVATLALANRLAHALLLGSSGNDTIYATEELCQLLKIEPHVIERIEETTREETDKIKFALLAQSSQGSWPQLRDEYSARLGAPFRPLFVSATPHYDAYGIFCRQLSDAIGDEKPNIGVMHLTHTRERVSLAGEFKTAETEAGVSNLPLIVLAPTAKIKPEDSLLHGRTCRHLTTPFAVDRLLDAVRQVVPAEQPPVESSSDRAAA